MPEDINTQSLLWQRVKGGKGGDPVTATIHLYTPLPLLACLSLIDPKASYPPVASSLSKTARPHYLSVTMSLFGRGMWGCWCKTTSTQILSSEWTRREGGRREKERERLGGSMGWDREKIMSKAGLSEEKKKHYLFIPGHSHVRSNDTALAQTHSYHYTVPPGFCKLFGDCWEKKCLILFYI